MKQVWELKMTQESEALHPHSRSLSLWVQPRLLKGERYQALDKTGFLKSEEGQTELVGNRYSTGAIRHLVWSGGHGLKSKHLPVLLETKKMVQ